MDTLTKKQLATTLQVIGIIILTSSIIIQLFSALDQWTTFLLTTLGTGTLLSGNMVKCWEPQLSKVAKSLIIVFGILVIMAIILILISKPDTFLYGFAEGSMAVALFTAVIIFFKVNT